MLQVDKPSEHLSDLNIKQEGFEYAPLMPQELNESDQVSSNRACILPMNFSVEQIQYHIAYALIAEVDMDCSGTRCLDGD